MRKIFPFVLALATSVGVFAQQALWSERTTWSPRVNDDKSVTFSIKAPKADKVLVTGEFVTGAAEMTKDKDGIWTYTTAPLSPELYIYNIVVDDVKIVDPSNVYQIRDTGTLFSYFIVPGDHSYNYAVNDVPHGSVTRVWYNSPVLGMKRRMSVYTPAGYEHNSERYPVIYLLHGMGGDEDAWLSLGRAAQIFDNLIANGKMKPAIVVMPNGNVDMEAAPGETKDGLITPTTDLPHTMEGSYEVAFPDIVAFVDKTYRTISDKSHRAIAGLSMGGFHSLHISKEYPDMFDYVGLFSAAINPLKANDSSVYKNFDEKLKAQFADAPKLYWIAIGDRDFLYDENVDFRKRLDRLGLKYEYTESDGGHIWRNWRDYLCKFVSLLF